MNCGERELETHEQEGGLASLLQRPSALVADKETKLGKIVALLSD